MSEDSTASTGETASNYLEKITPKDLVMFSPNTRKTIAKNDFKYLDVDYDLEFKSEDEKKKIRVWGLPYISLFDPIPFGVFSGATIGTLLNLYRSRPPTSNIYVHLLSAAAVAFTTNATYKVAEKYKTERELVTWDYIKKHPQDFPEVFNAPRKYKDMLLPWSAAR